MSKRRTSKKAAPPSKTMKPKGTLPNPSGQYAAFLEQLRRLFKADNFAAADELVTQQAALLHDRQDFTLELMLAQLSLNLGRYKETLTHVSRALSLCEDSEVAHYYASHAHYALKELDSALDEIQQALALNPQDLHYRFHKATILVELFRHTEAIPLYEQLLKQFPNNSKVLNNAGNLYRDLGELKRAQALYQRAVPQAGNDSLPYSNYLTCLHYDPDASADFIFRACQEWEHYFPFSRENSRPDTRTIDGASKRLRVGMISSGFNGHPVGRMVTSALEKLPTHAFELFFYSGNGKSDEINQRFQAMGHYSLVTHLSDEDLEVRIRQDQIDILIDLAGHNSGNRMRVMAMTPAPVQVKWVGGLINTTGLNSIDYLISDNIETPEGVDGLYSEKLIRMPGDYICYEMPDYMPDIASLPAKRNGYITLGCFNNPTKTNPVILEQWAKIMHTLPNSRLYLKGHYYTSDELRRRILEQLQGYGIESDRVLIEGPSVHRELLACYNQVDIALDPWPYSGGLTTCEALTMGVPVVTLPGPTFAGRHSATHLVNAGMPELVTNSWDEYRERVIELASDLDSLATIRSHLRSILLQSPVCDADTFAGHLNNALRAIWQRYTEGKEPAALHFTDQGEVIFEGENTPVELHHPAAPECTEKSGFHWQFDGKVIAIDQGARLFDVPVTRQMLDAGTLELIAFDPSSQKLKHPLRSASGVHYYPNIVLGTGAPGTLYACQDPALSGTLRPMPEQAPASQQSGLTLLAQLPINTLALDKVSELPSVDWLLLDALNNSLDTLEQGENSLHDTLLLHADVAFQSSHERQPNFTELSHWASRHGFRFYCFIGEETQTPVPQNIIGANHYADELLAATAVFIPSQVRLSKLSNNQRRKLAFIADTAYGLEGLAYEVLSQNGETEADEYIQYKVQKRVAEKQPHVPTTGIRRKPRVVSAPVENNAESNEIIGKPELTLPADAARHLRKIYAQANNILEYGSGGSTVVAAEMAGKQIFTVENDLAWADKMRRYLQQAETASNAIIHSVNIGKTGTWARPTDDSGWRQFHQYPLSVWDRADFVQPDVVLIDGRFRVACFVATYLRITKPTIVLFDDYADRDYYHQVERLAKPVKMVGRMAHFELVPNELPRDELTWMLASFNQVTYADNTRR